MGWNDLTEAYAREGVVLAIGAGVSVGSGIPTWHNLLRRLMEELFEGEEVQFEDLAIYGLTAPIISSLIEERARSRARFVDSVRDALYRDFPFYPDGIDKSNRRRFVEHVREGNPTLRSVAALCASPRPNSSRFDANRRVHAVVNFNLDALLQAYVYARYEKRLLRTTERPSASRNPEKISTYHMHGFLRFDKNQGDRTKENPSVILTEQDYFDFFNNPTSVFNYTFLYLLREYPMLFIGLSMRDDNIRRLLHYSKSERLRAYQQEGLDPPRSSKLRRHYAVLLRSQPTVDAAFADTLSALGTSVLWVDDFAELPMRLGEMYTAGGEDWESVF